MSTSWKIGRGRSDVAEIGEGVPLPRRAPPGPTGALPGAGGHRWCQHRAGAADTDWHQIARLYGQLARFLPTPVVELNRAVAVGMAGARRPGWR